MSNLFELIERPSLDDPVFVVALDGWIDAGLGAAQALATVLEGSEMTTVATFDTDVLLDHRARRPTLQIDDGLNAGLTWPSIELRIVIDQNGQEFLFLMGAEPDHQWRAFSKAAVDLALEFGSRIVIGLGAYPAPTPHTRPVRVVANATNRDLADLVGHLPGSVEVPAGVQAAIERRCADVGIPAVGLWAQVPHYAAAMPYPAASLGLLQSLSRVTGLSFDLDDLAQEATDGIDRLDVLVEGNPEHVEMVRQLELHVDTSPSGLVDEAEPSSVTMDDADLPTGDELAEELQKFLRDQEP